MGTQVASKIDEKGTAATTALGNLNNAFNSKVDSSKVSIDDDTVNRAVNDTTNFVKNADDVKRLTTVRDATYQGPNSLTDLSDEYLTANSAFNDADEIVNNSQTEQGRMALAQDVF